jgi:hypothetical protein
MLLLVVVARMKMGFKERQEQQLWVASRRGGAACL